MIFKSRFEKKLAAQLKTSFDDAAPDIFNKIKDRLEINSATNELSMKGAVEMKNQPSKLKKNIFRAVTATLTITVICGGFAWFYINKLPILQAKAEVLYDNGGYLAAPNDAQKPDSTFTLAYNTFGYNLFKQVYDGKSNAFISPASIYTALGMTYNGAAGDTAKEFAQVLGVKNLSLNDFNNSTRNLQYLITSKDSRFKLANSIWIRDSFAQAVSGSFIDRDKAFFGVTAQTLDFNSPSTPTVINNWVKDKTNGLLDAGIDKININTVMYLINTIYFKADWKQKFDGNSTNDGSFETSSGAKTVKFMHGTFSGYAESESYQSIVLPYDDGKTSMVIILPKTTLPDMIKNIKAEDIAVLAKSSSNKIASLSLPRVKLTYSKDLSETLQNIGLKKAFDASADFSNMLISNSGESIFISKVQHNTYLAIDEKGTEAAAMTNVTMSKASMPLLKIMNVNKPFLTAIVDNATGAILFIGTVTDPI